MNTLAFLISFLLCHVEHLTCATEENTENIILDRFSEQVKNLGYYDIVTPVKLAAGSLEGEDIRPSIFEIKAFGTVYSITVTKQTKSNYHGAKIEYIGKNNTYQGKILDKVDCFYTGTASISNSNESSTVILNGCDGLEGIISTESSMLFIQPIKTQDTFKKTLHRKHIVYRREDLLVKENQSDSLDRDPLDAPRVGSKESNRSRVRRAATYRSFLSVRNRSGRRVQLYYLDAYEREVPFMTFLVGEKRGINTFVGTVWIAKDDSTNQILLLNGKTKYISEENDSRKRDVLIISKPVGISFNEITESNDVDGDEHYIEVMVIADESVTKFHGKNNVEKYILTMMNIAAYVFREKSVGVRINFQVVRIVIIEDAEVGFRVYERNPTRTLVSACNYVSTLQNENVEHEDHFDFAVVLTRKDFGPSGYAQLYSMCSRRRSCVMVQDEGLTSAFIVAHETGHLLGLDHDGEGESTRCASEGSRGSIMAPVIVARYDRFHWSQCSKEVLKENIIYFHCLKNKPSEIKNKLVGKSTGSLYTLDEQCQFNFDKRYSKCGTFSFDPCRILWCSDPIRPSYCKTMRGPALEGSVCGKNKYCSKGSCTYQSDNRLSTVIKTTTPKPVINGNWGSWYSWSSCSQTCGLGIRVRIRNCDSPRPGPKGKLCEGDSQERDVCNTQKCSVSRSYKAIRNEQCERWNSQGWTLYTDSAFNVRLRQRRNDLNCTFDNNLCNWKNDGKNNDLNWLSNAGKTPSYKTGPEQDHTQGNETGNYLFIEASSTFNHSKNQGDVARLLSPTIRVPRVCFSMYYHMYGRDMGEINLIMLYSNGSEANVWKVSGDQENKWNNVQVSFESTSDYKIIIQATRGRHWASDAAIDDVTAFSGLCEDKTKESNPCQLSCRSRDARSFQMNLSVRDGLKCYNDRRSNICFDGKCVNFGCDNKFGSLLTYDNCMVCGGNGSLCVRKIGRKEILPYKDYQVVVELQKGSTFINLTEDSLNSRYFGLRKISNNGVYLSTRLEDYYVINGNTFHFKKDINGKQEIRSDGPITETIEIIVYSFRSQRNKPVALKYEYFEPATEKFTYKYEIKEWKPCSQSCGTGKQQSQALCVRYPDVQQVDDEFCKDMKKPLYVRLCEMEACPEKYKWVIRGWSLCSKTCGGGYQTREIRCSRTRDDAFVDFTYCSDPVPSNRRTCKIMECPRVYKWQTGDWGSCSDSCGGGLRTRNTSCIDEITKAAVGDENCKSGEKPDILEPCNIQECDTFIWNVFIEGKCSRTCGGGIRARIINCISEKTKLPVENKYCDGPSPLRIAPCNEQLCPEYIWNVGESSPCSVTCGDGTITRQISCIDKVSQQNVDERNCRSERPNNVVKCFERSCLSYKVAFTVWSSCSSLCGLGVQTRGAYCITSDYKTIVSPNQCKKGNFSLQRTCTKTPCAKPDDLESNFENKKFGSWTNPNGDDFDWTIANRTPSFNTGPLNDHTTNTGFFAYIEASRPRKQGEKAQLLSPYLKLPTGCLTFWYHMRGSTVGKLKVYVSTRQEKRLKFEKEGYQGRVWFQGKINVDEKNATGGYRYIIEATVGYGVYGDIAIDDIIFYEQSCDEIDQIPTKITVPAGCREISPYCNHASKKQYCVESKAYRALCCKTCAQILS